ncbi:MAG: dihydrodipicolinate synthase family protein [Planctomycetaceae bacterium]
MAAPLYRTLIDAFESGDLHAAREAQAKSVAFIEIMARHPFHAAAKCVLKKLGFDFGTCRLPQASLDLTDERSLLNDLDAIGFFA